MSDILEMGAQILADAGFGSERISINGRDALAFENETVLGFLFAYEHPAELISCWEFDSNRAITERQLSLRRAGQKAWNTYLILLSAAPAEYQESIGLSAIEEDLSRTRKIARSGTRSLSEIRAALLSLLPLQSAPRLDAVDIVAEIRQRTTELDPRILDAFLAKADDSIVLQVMEQAT